MTLCYSMYMDIPVISADQARELDRLMAEEFEISVTMMMEHAARHTAALTQSLVYGNLKDKHIIILAGKGNNGGDGLGAARFLTNWGARVTCILAEPPSHLSKHAGDQYKILKASNILELPAEEGMPLLSDPATDLIIDALLGYSLKGNPKKPYDSLIRTANVSKAPVLSVDIPSGLDPNSGTPHTPCIVAKATLTFALPKTGLFELQATEYVGDLYLADISVPKRVYKTLEIDVPTIFSEEDIVKIR